MTAGTTSGATAKSRKLRQKPNETERLGKWAEGRPDQEPNPGLVKTQMVSAENPDLTQPNNQQPTSNQKLMLLG